MTALTDMHNRLRSRLLDLDAVMVAFSGGADSAFLTWMAQQTLGGDRVTAVTAVSPSLPGAEHSECAALAREWKLDWLEVFTEEMHNAAYRRNDAMRCFWCKDSLMDALVPLVSHGGERPGATIVLGVNVDDLGEHRPGQRAASEKGAVFPLVEAGYTKSDVRQASREFGLRTWDKPAAACLASRVPYGDPVTVEVLSRIERGEAALRELGFSALRVRHYDDTARIEVPLVDLDRVLVMRAEVVDAVKRSGYRYVTVDLEGLRSGNLNDSLAAKDHE